jgi:ElaB/YqjD/DUF883 family membrane-anchored ribosome-binding protein
MSLDTVKAPEQGVAARIVDTARQAAHLSHEARAVKSVAEDAIEDAVHGAKRALRRGSQKLEDIRDEGIHCVKRQPFTSIAIALGVGFMVGVTVSRIVGRLRGYPVSKG